MKFGDYVVKHKRIILIIMILLVIPAIIGMLATKVNYDVLVYLPKDIETMKGEQILTDDFDMGAFSITVVDNMAAKDILKLEDKIRDIKGVNKVVTVNDLTGTTIPEEVLPDKILTKVKKGNSKLMLITFNDSTSNSKTLEAVSQIRKITKDSCKIGGMSSVVLDTMNLSDSEVPIYVLIAVALCIVVLMMFLDSYVVPFILLANIGIAILYNMGTNFFLGDISYITKAISAVLQLGVTTDFSIFLYHKYEKAKTKYTDKGEAMSVAIHDTMISVIGSSLTTIAGFLALCTMKLGLGADIGIVMAKGVLLGVVCVLTVFPALLLYFDKQIDKYQHKPLLPNFTPLNNFVSKHYIIIFIIFLLLFIPAWYGQKNTKVYYNLDRTLPATLKSSIANSELKKKFNIVSPEVILISKDVKTSDVNQMIKKIEKVKGIDFVLAGTQLKELGIPDEMIDDEVKSTFENDKYQMLLVNSTYKVASTNLTKQIKEVNTITKKYDKKAIVAGEGPLTNDLIKISNTDFNNVNITSIVVIFLIMLFVLKSISLPVILVCTIELAIFINMGIPYYTGTSLPFIASIVIGTIQLGATIDYAILMTTKYIEKRQAGRDKMAAIHSALNNSVSSIFVSGMCFFAATFGVAIYSNLEMISSLCTLISRGAIISMIVVITILPSLLIIFDKLICKTTWGFKKEA